MGERRGLLVTAPRLVSELFVRYSDRISKSVGHQRARGLLGTGLITSDGDLNRQRRRLVAPALARGPVAAAAPTFVRLAETAVARIDGRFDAHAAMDSLAIEIVGATVLGVDLSEDAGRLRTALAVLLDGMVRLDEPLTVFADADPLGHARLLRACDQIHLVAGDVVERGRGQLLERLQAPGPDALDAAAIHDEVTSVLLAGHETTGSALTFALMLLAAQPDLQESLRPECEAALDRFSSDGDLTAALARLPRTRAALLEALRLFPPVWATSRVANEAFELGGQFVAPGTVLTFSPYAMQRDPQHFTDPERFDPDRFAPGSETSRSPAFMPFGVGRHRCLGSQFALVESLLVLAVCVRRLRVALCPATRLELAPAMTLKPSGGLVVEAVHV